MVGDCKTGKTTISKRITEDGVGFLYEPTVGVDFFVKTLAYEGKSVKVKLWDTAGDGKFKDIVAKYYEKGQFVVVVYATNNRASF